VETGDVELVAYIRPLWRWKWLIVIGSVAAALAALVLGARDSQPHVATQTFDIGVPTDEQARQLQRVLQLYARFPAEGAAPAVLENPVAGVITVTVRSVSENDARERLAVTARDVEGALRPVVEMEQRRIAAIEKRRDALAALASQTREVQAKAVASATGENAALLYIATSEMAIRLDSQVAALSALLDGRQQPALSIGHPTIRPELSLGSGRMRAAVAGMGGLMLFMIVALGIDYWLTTIRPRL
jgi:hypothetical protein